MSNKFNFRADEFRGDAIDVKAEQFDYQLEQLLNKRKGPKPDTLKPGEDADLLLLAIRLRQEAPQPVRPDPAFQARLGAELRKRAERSLAAKTPQKSRFFGWRLAGGLALTTAFALVAAVTLVVANPFGSTAPNSSVDSVVGMNLKPTSLSTTLAAFTTMGAVVALPTKSSTGETTPSPVSNRTSTVNQVELTANDNINATLTSLTVGQQFGVTPKVISPFLNPTQNNATGNVNLTDFSFNVKATMPPLPSNSEIFHEQLVQISEGAMWKFGQQFGFDPSNAKYSTVQDNSSPAANITPLAYLLTNSTNKTLKISSEGELDYQDDSVAGSATSKLLDAQTSQQIAVNFLGKLGLSWNNSQCQWGNFQISASKVLTSNDVNVVFSPTQFLPQNGQTEKLITNSRAMTLTISNDGQVVGFDSSLPLSINEQGQLMFAPMDALSSPAITPQQLQQDLASNQSQIHFTDETFQRLQQQNFALQPNVIINLDSMEAGYMITTNKQADMMLVPVVLIHGTTIINNQPVEIEGYISQVQN